MSAGVDLRKVYPDPFAPGSGYESAFDIQTRQYAFGQDAVHKIRDLTQAAAHLNTLVGRRELQDPHWRHLAPALRNARVEALRAIDGLLADLGDGGD